MLDYGTNIVAGVTPGKGGQDVENIPVYDTVAEAATEQGARASVILVPAAAVKGAALEAIAAGLSPIIVITERVPVHDSMEIKARAREKGVRLIGPNCPGLITPGEAKLGIMPSNVFSPGSVGIVSRSGTLSYEVSANLTAAGIGQSTMVGIGGEAVVFTGMDEVLELFAGDPGTKLVAVLGEVGGIQEEEAARFVAAGKINKPVVACIVGQNAPEGKRIGHPGAIIQHGKGTHQSKVNALRQAGVEVTTSPLEVVELAKRHL
jgi:succinyl-CoA synthetase alpha subunit